jgi:hypothetical protein
MDPSKLNRKTPSSFLRGKIIERFFSAITQTGLERLAHEACRYLLCRFALAVVFTREFLGIDDTTIHSALFYPKNMPRVVELAVG